MPDLRWLQPCSISQVQLPVVILSHPLSLTGQCQAWSPIQWLSGAQAHPRAGGHRSRPTDATPTAL